MDKVNVIRMLKDLLQAYRETGNIRFLARARAMELKLVGNN